MMNANEYRLVVDVNDLRAFDNELLRKYVLKIGARARASAPIVL